MHLWRRIDQILCRPQARHRRRRRSGAWPSVAPIVLLAAGLAGCGGGDRDPAPLPRAATAPPAPVPPGTVVVEDGPLRSLRVEPVRSVAFRVETTATGRIAFNDDLLTPVFSPYTGRVVRLIAKPGDDVMQGEPLFEIETTDLVQAESDLIVAASAVVKATNQLELARRTLERQNALYEVRAVALKDLEQAASDVRSAESDLRGAEGAHAAARDRLRVFGKSEADIARIEEERRIDRVTRVPAPITGTVTARKVGPGQYVKPDSQDPLFTLADLSSMWLLANVYESDVPSMAPGQLLEVRVLALPAETFHARIRYIAAAADPVTHRVAVRADVANRGRTLKPEMLATFRIMPADVTRSPGVPTSAVVRDDDTPFVWTEAGHGQFVRRAVTLGHEQGGMVQVLTGLDQGERVVTDGAVLVSRAAETSR